MQRKKKETKKKKGQNKVLFNLARNLSPSVKLQQFHPSYLPTTIGQFVQSGYIANFRLSVAGSSPRSRRQRWNNRRSMGYCSRLARCCPATSALTVRATSRCLCTLINGSRYIDGGSGARASKTSGCAGGEKLPWTGSMLTNSVGAVGSIKSGRRQTRCNGAR